MKKIARHLLALLIAGVTWASCSTTESHRPYNDGVHIIPQPRSLTVTQEGAWTLTSGTAIAISTDSLQTVAQFFADKISASTGYKIAVESAKDLAASQITLSIVSADEVPHPEGYTLRVISAEGVQIAASTLQGAFYGMRTLMQLLPAEIESPKRVRGIEWSLPYVEIADEPRFAYRGLHLDVCRHFLPVENVKKHIDVLSMLKMNKLHFHLTEDQAWRIEIKKYPRLTEIGAQRVEGDGTTYGPYYYTQDEIRDIVAYAQERFVEVIPEIEMPGHAVAALAAYPHLGCYGADHPYEVRNYWGISDDILCAGNDEVFTFLTDVIDEIAPLFPSKYFHIGGDEAPKVRWQECPKCQERIRQEGLKDEHELQSYFIRRIEKEILRHGKRLIGWEEILQGGLAPSATVMSWTGEQGGIVSANMGHDVIMTPASHGLYFDFYQGDPKVEPTAICCKSLLPTVYDYDPIPDEIAEEKRHHVLGVQGNTWAENIYTPSHHEYVAYPRAFAVAEIGWTPLDRKDYTDFLRRLEHNLVRLDMQEVNYYIPQPEQVGDSYNTVAFHKGDSATLDFTSTYPVTFVYTTDGSEPTAKSSSSYGSAKFSFTTDATLKIRSMTTAGKLSPTRTITITAQEYAPAVAQLDSSYSMGLHRCLVEGPESHMMKPAEVKDKGEEGVATDIPRERRRTHNPDGSDYRFAALYEGYFLVPADGVYRFNTDHDFLIIDDVELINNGGEIGKFSRGDASIALAAGLHRIRFMNVGRIAGGYPSQWSAFGVRWKLDTIETPWSSLTDFYHKSTI